MPRRNQKTNIKQTLTDCAIDADFCHDVVVETSEVPRKLPIPRDL
jgi:hypothetical protein